MNGKISTPPQIRQTIFILDKTRSYKFDVNASITIKNLKKMIVAAANLGKNTFRIFHKGIEYTDHNDDTLDELFPNLQIVEFNTSIVYHSEEDLESYIKVRFKPFCYKHQHKYPYFYCYDCACSICSLCVQSGEHLTHNSIEKYDYLQSSRNLVEKIFYDLKEILSGAKMDNQELVENLKQRISIQFFPKLCEIVKCIERKLISLIDLFFENEKGNFKHLQENVILLKNHCAEGLDKLKSEIAIEDMMLDEEIFLTFDRKFKDIANEKGKISNDVEKFREFRNQLNLITNSVDNIYNEIHSFLEKYVNSPIFDEIKSKVEENAVQEVSREMIFYKLLSDVKKRDRRTVSATKKSEEKPVTEFPSIAHFDVEEKLQLPSQPQGLIPSSKRKQVHIGKIIPDSKEMLIYSKSSETILKKLVQFEPLHGISHFLPECAWINSNGKLFISGGLVNSIPSPIFLSYDISTETLNRHQDMLAPRHSHSLFFSNDFIYAVGGNVNSTEQYSIKDKSWTQLGNLNEDRMYPILYSHNNFLYAFCGLTKEGTYINTIERIKLKTGKAKWQFVSYKTKDAELKLIKCGIAKADDKTIYLFGGKGEDGLKNSAIMFKFSNFSVVKTEFTLEQPIGFQESKLMSLGDHSFGNFSDDKTDTFLKIEFA